MAPNCHFGDSVVSMNRMKLKLELLWVGLGYSISSDPWDAGLKFLVCPANSGTANLVRFELWLYCSETVVIAQFNSAPNFLKSSGNLQGHERNDIAKLHASPMLSRH